MPGGYSAMTLLSVPASNSEGFAAGPTSALRRAWQILQWADWRGSAACLRAQKATAPVGGILWRAIRTCRSPPRPSPASASCQSRGTSSWRSRDAHGPAVACPFADRACRARDGNERRAGAYRAARRAPVPCGSRFTVPRIELLRIYRDVTEQARSMSGPGHQFDDAAQAGLAAE